MGFPVELVEPLKHTDVEEKKLTWNIQANASAVTVNLIWIKAEEPMRISLCICMYIYINNDLIPFRLPLV
jgi:hypothetical protein